MSPACSDHLPGEGWDPRRDLSVSQGFPGVLRGKQAGVGDGDEGKEICEQGNSVAQWSVMVELEQRGGIASHMDFEN